MLGNMLKEIQATVFKKTIAGTYFRGYSKLLPKIFASGGLVHLAAGGAMKRDRVPAMLEPGEFVIRKKRLKSWYLANLLR